MLFVAHEFVLRVVLPRHVACDVHPLATQEVHATLWIAAEELRGRCGAGAEVLGVGIL